VRRDPISKFVCDGVSYRDFSTAARKPRDGNLPVTFRFLLYDEPGVDKRVDVAITVARGDVSIGTGVLKNIKLGEKKNVRKEIELSLPVAAIEGSGPAPLVRLTTVVRDDP
jgi:hypothetical protein